MKRHLALFIITMMFGRLTYAQSQYQPYSYQFYQKFNTELYSPLSRQHTALKPFFVDDSLLKPHYDSLMNYGTDGAKHSWGYRKLLNEHLIDIKDKEYTFYADYLPDLTQGRDFSTNKTVWLNTRGYQLGGTIGTKFYFYTSGFENQAVFPSYFDTYVNQTGIVSGQAYDRNNGLKRAKDWSYVTALVSYTPVKFLNVSLGQDKTFIGDGYRSVLLSDFASPYPFFKLTATLGNVRYMAMWAYMDDPTATKFDSFGNHRRKWGVFHYLDWNVSNRLTLGFFDSVIWADADDQGHKRGFDYNYINPFIFLRPVEAQSGSADNALIGFTGKYKISSGLTAYGQFALDEFEGKNFFSSNGSYRNKYSYQLGIRGTHLFSIPALNFLVEYNGAKPYTYSERIAVINYTEQNEPLAHPFGANFRELVGQLNYSWKRFDFSGEADYGHYGLDAGGLNYGKDLFQLYSNPAKLTGNYIGQGLTTNMYYLEGKIAYLVNPKYNLRLEIGGLYRKERNAAFDDRTTMLTIGLRSSFRNLYTDISSYKVH